VETPAKGLSLNESELVRLYRRLPDFKQEILVKTLQGYLGPDTGERPFSTMMVSVGGVSGKRFIV